MVDGCEFENLNCLHDNDKATAMTFRLWLIFGRSQVWRQPRGEAPPGKEVITMSDKQG